MGSCFGKKSEDPKIVSQEIKLTSNCSYVQVTTVDFAKKKVEVQHLIRRWGFSNDHQESHWVRRDIPLRTYGIDGSSPTLEEKKPLTLVYSLYDET